ncbi:MAG: rpsU [Gammaproteobacteria bacterium]|jgi:small subunit ribosomal protein S21|nr:rpsU [Gammaproteobacteria bacterium]
MPSIRVKDNENFEITLRKFKRLIEKIGLQTDLRRHEFYEKPTWKRKRKKASAIKRHQKKMSRAVITKDKDRQR